MNETSRTTWDRRDWGIIAALAALVTLVLGDVLFLGRNFYVRDVYSFYYPTKKLVRDLILSGAFQWNPHYGAGQPMAANPEYEIFYPMQWLIFVGRYAFGFRLHVIAHVYLAIIGAYAFLRSLELRRVAAAAGAISFALGGAVLSNTALLPYLFALAWAPVIALFSRRYLLEGAVRDLAGASLALGMQFLIGEPTTSMQAVLVLFLASLFAARTAASIRRAASIVVGGVLVGAAQIIPTIDFARDTVRSWVFPYPLVVSWSMPPARLFELLHPTIFGRYFDSMRWYWGGSLYSTGTPFYWSIYSGVTIAAFAIAAVFSVRRGRALFLTIVVVSAILSIGGHTPLFEFLYRIGAARNLRYPEKFVLMAICAIVVYGAVGLDRFLDRDRATFRAVSAVVAIVGAATISVAALAQSQTYGRLFQATFRIPSGPVGDYEAALSTTGWWIELLRIALFAAVLVLAWQWRDRRAAALILAFVTIDVVSVSREASPAIESDFYDRPPVAASAKPSRIFNAASWMFLNSDVPSLPRRGDGFYWIVRNGILLKNSALWKLDPVLDDDYDLTNLVPTTRFVQAMWIARPHVTAWPQPFATMADASLYATLSDPVVTMRRARGDWRTIDPIQMTAVSTAGRYYFADYVATFADDADFAARVAVPGVTARTAFLEAGTRVPTGEARVLSVVEGPESATVRIAAKQNGFLVRSVTPHRYWRAWIDGSPVPIVSTNIAFQGVVVPAGAHTIVFRYHNPLLLPSALISLSGVAAALVLRIGRRRGAGESTGQFPYNARHR